MADKKAGDVIEFSGHLKLPCEATGSQVREWVEYETGARPDIRLDNPLRNFDLEARGLRCDHFL